MKLAMKQKVYNKKLLETCKGWFDQCNTQQKLGKIVAKNQTCQKVELTYYDHNHNSDIVTWPVLFCLNKSSYEERLESFHFTSDIVAWSDLFCLNKAPMRKGCEAFILLSDTGNAKETIADLPSNGDVLAVI